MIQCYPPLLSIFKDEFAPVMQEYGVAVNRVQVDGAGHHISNVFHCHHGISEKRLVSKL